MSRAWKKLDLEGGGLQSANLRLVRLLKKRWIAYAAWLLFPLGAHAWYLRDRRRGLAYPALTALTAAAYATLSPLVALAPAAALVALALFDLFWIEPRLVGVNKALRMDVYLGQAPAAPPEFRGRYPEEDDLQGYIQEKEQERAGHPAAPPPPPRAAPKAPSFAQQEAMLRELARRRRGGDDKN